MRQTWIAGLLIAVACDNAITTPLAVTPSTFSLEKAPTNNGDLQRDSVFATIDPLRVLVRVDGAVAPGIRVFWVISADGINETSSTITDADGIASLGLTLGAKPTVYAIQATLRKVAGGPTVAFSVTATAGSVAEVRITAGANQTDTATALLNTPYTVQVSDAYGNRVPGVAIDWRVTAGGGSISPAQGTTSVLGEASARHTLGSSTGVNAVAASALGTSHAVTFHATATAARPAVLKMVSGDNQSAETNLKLPADYTVRVTDSYDNAVAGIEIEWSVMSGGGTLSSTRTVTGGDGSAGIRLTLGSTAGPQSVSATANELPGAPRVVFTSTATAPPPPPPPPPSTPPPVEPPLPPAFPPPPPTPPTESTTLRVTVSVTGVDVDNSFFLSFYQCSSNPRRCSESQTQTVSADATVSYTVLAGWNYRINVWEVAANCVVDEYFKTGTTIAGAVAELVFKVTCRGAGSIRVATSTTGTDFPSEYVIAVDQSVFASIGPSGFVTIGVGEGSHSIDLTRVAGNCSVAAPNPVSATVTRGGTTNVAFTVSCVNNPTVSVTVTTTGADLPGSYIVGVDRDFDTGDFVLTIPLPANGTNSIRVPVGNHVVYLDGVPPNCTISGDHYRIVDTRLGENVAVSFTVTCR